MTISSVLFSVLFNVNLTSFLKFLRVTRIVLLIGFLINHHFFLNIKGKTKSNNHAVESIEELGSNTENRFVIILCFFCLCLFFF